MNESQNKTTRRRVINESTEAVEEEKVEEMAKPRPTNFKMVKIFPGALGVMLEAYDFSTPARPFNFRWNTEYKIVPLKWAIGVFVSDDALKQMEVGDFTFENLDLLIEMAEEMGQYVPDSIKQPKITTKEIKQAIKSNEVKRIEALYPRLKGVAKDSLASISRRFYSSLKVEVIQSIEKFLGVSLKTVNLDD